MGLNLDVWDWKTKHFAKEVLQKSIVAEVGQGPFFMILSALGLIFMTFAALETGMKFDDFSWFHAGGKWLLAGP